MSSASTQHAELIELIFDCADSPGGLQPALEGIARALGADKAHGMLLHRGRLVHSESSGYDPSAFDEYERHWRERDPRFVAASTTLGRVLSDVEVVAPEAFEASDIYNDFLSKVGVRYTLFANQRVSSELVLAQSFMRPKGAGPFDAEQIRTLSALMPHLRRGHHLHHLVGSLKDEVHDLRRALDAMPGAVAILDARGRLLCANERCERLLVAGEGLRLVAQVLSAELPKDAEALSAAVAATSRLADEGALSSAGDGPGAVVVARGSKPPLTVVLTPLRSGNDLRTEGDRRSRILALVYEPDARLRLNPSALARAYGLTRTEALLAAALGEGRTLAEFAEGRGCSEETARTHLKRLLDKTGARRQVDLVRMLLGTGTFHAR